MCGMMLNSLASLSVCCAGVRSGRDVTTYSDSNAEYFLRALNTVSHPASVRFTTEMTLALKKNVFYKSWKQTF